MSAPAAVTAAAVTAEVLTAKLQSAPELQPLVEVHVEDLSGEAAAEGQRGGEGVLAGLAIGRAVARGGVRRRHARRIQQLRACACALTHPAARAFALHHRRLRRQV